LAEEEQKLLPIVSVTLTQSEWDALGKHGMSAIPVTRRLVILGYITEESDDAERQRFMQVVPAPARLAYKLIGHRQFTRETAAIRGYTNSSILLPPADASAATVPNRTGRISEGRRSPTTAPKAI